jgi:hypothetical protein
MTALELVETERVTLRADPPAAWPSPMFRTLYLSSLVAQQRLTEFISRGPEMEEPARTDLAKFLAGWIAGALNRRSQDAAGGATGETAPGALGPRV